MDTSCKCAGLRQKYFKIYGEQVKSCHHKISLTLGI